MTNPAKRVDEHSIFRMVMLVDQQTIEGEWRLTRPVGDLAIGYGAQLLLVCSKSGRTVPLSSVVVMTP